MNNQKRSQNIFRRPTLLLALVLVFIIYLSKLFYDIKNKEMEPALIDNISPVSLTRDPVNTQSCPDPAFQVYFTSPSSLTGSPKDEGLNKALAAAIDLAAKSIDMAIYNLSLEDVTSALLRARGRGVLVRMVMESDSLDREMPQKLASAGVPILGDRRESLMHHKFTIIDGLEVWTGSMNYTFSGIEVDNNNLIRICSKETALAYTGEFEKMFVGDQFGDNKSSSGLFPAAVVDGNRIEIYFSPQDGISRHLDPLLESAASSIHILAYNFTLDGLAETIIQRGDAGVEVRAVFDKDQAGSEGSDYPLFLKAGYDVHLDSNPGLMHHKVIIIDHKIVVTGSYNFTRSADEKNDENLLVIYDPAVALQFEQEFDRVAAQTEP